MTPMGDALAVGVANYKQMFVARREVLRSRCGSRVWFVAAGGAAVADRGAGRWRC